jgi:hypothetical protein
MSEGGVMEEGVLDPRVVEFFAANQMMGQPFERIGPWLRAAFEHTPTR